MCVCVCVFDFDCKVRDDNGDESKDGTKITRKRIKWNEMRRSNEKIFCRRGQKNKEERKNKKNQVSMKKVAEQYSVER